MEAQDQRVDKIKYLVDKLRYITLCVQILPFIYTGLYLVTMVLYLFVPESVCQILDALFYASPVVILGFLVESKILKLCKWHKTACALPLLPQAIVLTDSFIVSLTKYEAYIAIITPILLCALLLLAAYNVFMR